MEFSWLAENYREIVNECLGYRQQRRPKGVIKKLSEKLRCHATFIAQVLNGRADFSPEQGYDLCQHFSFSLEQQDFFLTLLMRDRSGTVGLKEHYRKKLNYLLKVNRDLSPSTSEDKPPLSTYEMEYFGSWMYQSIHALTQIRKFQSSAAISEMLGLSIAEVTDILLRLEKMDLVKKERSSWKSTVNSLHLPKDAHFIRNLHTTWKTKILADLQTSALAEGTRYSGLITVAEKDYQRVRVVLAKAIHEIRKIVEDSSSENLCVLSLDCYKLM